MSPRRHIDYLRLAWRGDLGPGQPLRQVDCRRMYGWIAAGALNHPPTSLDSLQGNEYLCCTLRRMDPGRFSSGSFGELGMSADGYYYYLPKPLARELQLTNDTILALSAADAALGRLSGVARLLTEPRMLVSPYMAREALASSKIEGTQASLDEIFQARAGGEPADDIDIREVNNYLAALTLGEDLVRSGEQISIKSILSLHRRLLFNVRANDKKPGTFRKAPVWIGSATDSPETAAFVPPMPEHLSTLLHDLERFIQDPPRLPALIRIGLMHYQFETIHPFLDGNGRVGRLLIIMSVLQERLLSIPLLYVSVYMEANRREYYERLQAVREQGDIQEWLQYFLTAIERQAVDAERRAERLVGLREKYRKALRGSKSRALDVAELLFTNPFVTVRRVESELQVTNQGARNLIESLEARGWLARTQDTGRGGRVYWYGAEVYEALEQPTLEVS
jgi:Fic family protein